MKRLLACASVVILVAGAFCASAANYLVSPSATVVGTEISYKNRSYKVGTTAFSSLSALAASHLEANSTIQVAPGTYNEDVTFTSAGLTLLGNNAYCDWSVTRAAETIITGTIAAEADNIKFNGFKLTGNGRFVSKTGTNAVPLSGIEFVYNISDASTLARSWDNPVVQIGTRVTDANTNSLSSQCRYKNCTVAHNTFVGDATHYAVSVVMSGVYGTSRVFDNHFTEGGTSIAFVNAQGDLRVKYNKFNKVGVSTAAAPDGGNKGDFCVALYYSAYANATTLDIKGNEFDGVQGQASFFCPIRIYPGASGAANLVTPKSLSVNINQNTFQNIAGTSANANQLGEKILMYADKGTTSGVKFDLSDNHYDHRFYKFAWVTLADGLGQREVYSNSADQFVFAGKYSSMGTSVIDGVDISYHASNVKIGTVTVMQSMDIDMQTGDMYFLQVMNDGAISSFCSKHGLSASTCDPLVLTRVRCTKKATATDGTFTYSTSVTKMNLAKTGHGVKLSVVRDSDGQLWMMTGGQGSDNGTKNDLSGKYIARFKFEAGKDLILDGSGKTDADVIYMKHPEGLSNAYGTVDEMNRYLCISSSGSGTRKYYIYDLDQYLNGDATPALYGSVALKKGDDPITGSGVSADAGFETYSYQSYCINGDYLYLLEGESEAGTTIDGQPSVIISTYNWRTGQFLQRWRVNYGRINNTFGEPEAITIRPDVFGNVSCYLGLADGVSGSRTQNVFKFHIDRHFDSTGTVIGDDTITGAKHFDSDQYSGVKMSPSESSISLTAETTVDKPTAAVTITRSSKYMYCSWLATITGVDGNVFSVSLSSHNQFASKFTATVTFAPDGLKNTYSAQLRLTSPGADDIIIPITATVKSTNPGPGTEPVETFEIDKLSEQWIYSTNTSNLTDLANFSSVAPNTRDMCFANGKLYVLNAAAKEVSVSILDAYTGKPTGTNLSVEGISEGTYILSGLKSLGSTVIGTNFCGAAGTLKVYKWDSDTATPTLWFATTAHGMEVGRSFNTYGDMNNGIIAYGSTSGVVYFTVTDGVVNPIPTTISGELKGNASNQSVAFVEDGTYWLNNKDNCPIHFSAGGSKLSQLDSSVAGNIQGSAIKGFNYGGHKYVAFTSCLGGAEAWSNAYMRLVDVTDENTPISKGSYPSAGLGTASWGGVGTNSVEYEVIDNNTLNLWVMVPCQGIAYYKHSYVPLGVGDVEIIDETAPVEWYNLQGVRVADDKLIPGIYVKRQGNKAQKVLVR